MDNLDIEMAVNDNVMDVEMELMVTCELAEIRDVDETSLLSLDDMVLNKVIKNLRAEDLSNLAETCVRLANLTEEHIKKQFTSISWERDLSCNNPNYLKPSETERVWKHIGKHVKTAKLSSWIGEELDEILRIMAKYCKNIVAITLCGISVTNSSILDDPLILSMFSKLKRFGLVECCWKWSCPLTFLFGINSSLEQLSLQRCFLNSRESCELRLSGFRSLKKLEVLHCKNVLANYDLRECFNNNYITSLVLSDVNKINLMESDLIDALVDTLESLEIDFGRVDFDELIRINKLKRLTIHCRNLSNIDSQLHKFEPDNVIEELVFSQIIISNQTVNALNNFKSLTSLRLNRCQNRVEREFFKYLPQVVPQLLQLVYAYNEISDRDILRIVKGMPKLRRLSLFACNALETKTYLEMEKILNDDWQRPKLEIIPPKFKTSKAFDEFKVIAKRVWLRINVNYL